MKKDESEVDFTETHLYAKGDYLLIHGWSEENRMKFNKDGIEIFFDSSDYIEIYIHGDYSRHLGSYQARSVEDMRLLLVEIKEGKFK